MITLAIAEDHQALIDGMKLFLKNETDIMIVGEANDGKALIELVKNKRPSVVITDIRMPKCDGITATKIIKKKYPEIKVIAFSMFDQADAVAQMKEAGASGYIMKNSSLQTVLKAIRTVARNELFFDNEIITKNETTKENIKFSPREKEIIRLVGQGKSSQEIADILQIVKATVDTYRKNIIKKLNLTGRNDFLRFAIERKYDF
jgi:two-component system nitrate/nitrite response regulator NarL